MGLPKNEEIVRSKIESNYCVSQWHLRQEKHHRSLLYNFHMDCLALIYEQGMDHHLQPTDVAILCSWV